MNSKNLALKIIGGVLLIAVLAGCSSPAPTPTLAPTVDTQSTLNAVKTQSVSTAVADLTKNAPAGTPTPNNFLGCTIIDFSPVLNTSFAPNTDFDATWVIKNTGAGQWQQNSVDISYSSGDKLQKSESVVDLKNTVASGESYTALVHMHAPASAGTYTTTWVVNSSTHVFCSMTLTIVVN